MTTTQTARYEQLKAWLEGYNITQQAIADKLNIRQQAVYLLLSGETMPTGHHAKLIALGFPENLLPMALDKPKGRPAKEPRWPALVNQA